MGEGRVLGAGDRGECPACGGLVARGEQAWWDAGSRRLWCLDCRRSPEADGPTARVRPSRAIDLGVPGRSAQARFDELHAQRAARLEQSWGRLAGIAKLLSPDPRSTTNWRRGAEGERVVAGQLERALGDRATLLCDRRIPHSNANIDLLAVAASGVWIVDVKHWSGKVEVRDVGAWRKTDRRLYVAGRDRSNAVDGLERQVVAVRRALYGRDVPLVACMCFTGAEWGLFARPFKVGAVRVTWTRKLAEMILEGGRLEPATVASIATALARRLPAK